MSQIYSKYSKIVSKKYSKKAGPPNRQIGLLMIPFGAPAHRWLNVSFVNAIADFNTEILSFANLF